MGSKQVALAVVASQERAEHAVAEFERATYARNSAAGRLSRQNTWVGISRTAGLPGARLSTGHI
eukprot:10353138-Lingulodinium_polyedra.AAC.1